MYLSLYKTLLISTIAVALAQWFRYDGGDIQLWLLSFVVWASLAVIAIFASLTMTFGSNVTVDKITARDDNYTNSVRMIESATPDFDYTPVKYRCALALLGVFVVMAFSFLRHGDMFELFFMAISLGFLYTGISRAFVVYNAALKKMRHNIDEMEI